MIRAENRLESAMVAQRLGIFAHSESLCGEFPAKLFNDHLRIDGGCECPENAGICFEKDPFWGY